MPEHFDTVNDAIAALDAYELDQRTPEEIAVDDYIAAETAREVLLDLPARPGVTR